MDNIENKMDSPKDAVANEINQDNEHEKEHKNEDIDAKEEIAAESDRPVEQDEKKTGIRINEETVRIITNVVITIFSTAALMGSIALGMKGKRRS